LVRDGCLGQRGEFDGQVQRYTPKPQCLSSVDLPAEKGAVTATIGIAPGGRSRFVATMSLRWAATASMGLETTIVGFIAPVRRRK